MKEVTIIGGGLAGLICGIRLARNGFDTVIIEKKPYPSHKVCGEYVSNEVFPFFQREELLDGLDDLPQLHRFQLTSENGNHATVDLNTGGFGISRFLFDHQLYKKALEAGAQVIQSEVRNFTYEETTDSFNCKLSDGSSVESRFLIGAYGKRSRLDKDMDRDFINRRSPWVGVKYHLNYDVPDDLITLHNFPGGYCGISKVENDVTNLCYLTKRENLLNSGDVGKMEETILSRNPYLKEIFEKGQILFEKPMVINEISFAPKSTTEDGMIMIGDSAGLIAPLCGNGMAMAIHAGKILSDLMIDGRTKGRKNIQKEYDQLWRSNFRTRLWMGRNLQKLFGKIGSSNGLVSLMKFQPSIAKYLINKTHGRSI